MAMWITCAMIPRLTGCTWDLAKTRPAAVGMVDATSNERLPEEYKLGAHPESFQAGNRRAEHLCESAGLEADCGDQSENRGDYAVGDDAGAPIFRWRWTKRITGCFVATHEPARMAVFDTNSGHTVAEFPCVQDADDVYYDSGRKRIYIPGGEGYISVFQQTDADHYQLLAKVPSALGARTAGYFGKGHKGFDRFFLGVPPRADHGAEIWIYTVQD